MCQCCSRGTCNDIKEVPLTSINIDFEHYAKNTNVINVVPSKYLVIRVIHHHWQHIVSFENRISVTWNN